MEKKLTHEDENELTCLIMNYLFSVEDLLYLGGRAGIDDELKEEYERSKEKAIEKMKSLDFNDETINAIITEFSDDEFYEDYIDSDNIDKDIMRFFTYEDTVMRYNRLKEEKYNTKNKIPDADRYVESDKISEYNIKYLTSFLTNANSLYEHNAKLKDIVAKQTAEEFSWCGINNATIKEIFKNHGIDESLAKDDDSIADEEIVELFTPDNMSKRIERLARENVVNLKDKNL